MTPTNGKVCVCGHHRDEHPMVSQRPGPCQICQCPGYLPRSDVVTSDPPSYMYVVFGPSGDVVRTIHRAFDVQDLEAGRFHPEPHFRVVKYVKS